MKNKTKKISPAQLFFFIIQTQIGVGILSLPYSMAQASKIDGWISLILGGIGVQIFIILYYIIMKKFPNKKVKEIVEILFGKIIRKLFEIGLLFYSLIVGVLIINLYKRILDIWVLPETPNWIISLLLVVCCYFLAKEEIRVIARFYVIVSLLLFIFLGLIIYSFKDANIFYIMPVGSSGWKDILFGTKDAIIALLGFEIIMFLTAMTSGTLKLKIKFITAANIVVTIFYLLATIACFLFFSPVDILLIPETLLYLIKAFSFKIIERPDLLFLIIWIVSVFTSFVSYVFWGADCIKGIFRSEKSSVNTLIMLAIIYFAGLIPLDTEQSMNQFAKYASYAGYMIVSIPFILLPFVLYSRKGQQLHAKDK
ncbi:GerAB/ArcD/ProY family transporter [Bacillus sp. DTU_2020_1000418_1_SI_GHA_SEK_038]|uniref:GerAB/ArcD/ProY family transporter n=1 Tax=Bacillus sp. DTU_2020_1000418_1_SI_GHA_SEK_038 TaxID=3077585 RepID=UPI0028E65248|nr:GerAB/ArcD/ProY family transporter [Bacillus sp. DTU_2020_1000418_1_SI_GHA_SEK_038]WNS73472.1 GerAB/ArcD/ProY family transporter [Bacillus sp. DTU_2020_1000418_1_SI_GHA_SEK_038]